MALKCQTIVARIQDANARTRPVRLTFFDGSQVQCGIEYRPRENIDDLCRHQYKAVDADETVFGGYIGSIRHIHVL